jgi:hypothetical protein
MRSRFSWFNATAITLGFAFLYIPILLLVIYSFNESKLVTVWGGWSTKWYGSLLENQSLKDAAWVTIRVAFLSATVATALGTLAAITLVRLGRFPGRTLFSGMIFAPLVMPEVITGLSLLLLFVALDLDRGFWTITIAHITFTMCFAAVVVQARLADFDKSVEEAAMDLGATPVPGDQRHLDDPDRHCHARRIDRRVFLEALGGTRRPRTPPGVRRRRLGTLIPLTRWPDLTPPSSAKRKCRFWPWMAASEGGHGVNGTSPHAKFVLGLDAS